MRWRPFCARASSSDTARSASSSRPARPATRPIDDAAVPGHEGAQLCALLCAHGLDDAAAGLRQAHRRRRDAVQTLRRLVDLDRRGLLDATAVGGCLGEAAEDLAAAGRGRPALALSGIPRAASQLAAAAQPPLKQ
ncbi:MAG: hypothetical protein ACRD0K_27140 [Egibacteraceae bacterium]